MSRRPPTVDQNQPAWLSGGRETSTRRPDSLLSLGKGEPGTSPGISVDHGHTRDTARHRDDRNEALVLVLADEVVERLFERARQLGLIERPRRWAELDGVADYLGVSRRRIYDLRARGLPAKLIGRRLLFDLREVDAWLEREGWTE